MAVTTLGMDLAKGIFPLPRVISIYTSLNRIGLDGMSLNSLS